MAIQFQFITCESAAETLFSFTFSTQKIKLIKLLPVLIHFQEHNIKKLKCEKEGTKGSDSGKVW